MIALSPIWLVGLVPWAGLAAWMMWGKRQRMRVPFVRLWHGPLPAPAAKRKIEVPPLAVVLVLIALLGAILAAARLASTWSVRSQNPVVVLVDRGFSMSARHGQERRFRELAREVIAELKSRLAPQTQVQLISVPGELAQWTTLGSLDRQIDQLAPTAVQTRGELESKLAGPIAQSDGLVVVLSDQWLHLSDPRVIQIAPGSSLVDLGISQLAARESPAPQVMVGVRNLSSLRSALLVASSGQQSAQRTIELPTYGQERNYFLDLPRLGAIVSAELRVNDDMEADDRAWLVRQGGRPKIEPRAAFSPELQRVLIAYESTHPASQNALRIPLVPDARDAPAAGPAIVVNRSAANATATGSVHVTQHAITEHVRWNDLPGPVSIGPDPPSGWTPLVQAAGHVLLAIRNEPARQVWVGFDAPQWAGTSDFVIFWTNVFDWAGGSAAELFSSHDLSQWRAEWKPLEQLPGAAGQWPGLYQRADRSLRAFNAPAIPIRAAPQWDWRARLAVLQRGQRAATTLSPLLLICSCLCLVFAAATWKRQRGA